MKILSAQDYNKLKVAIQLSGKLGFTAETAKKLNITTESGIKFALNDDNDLYLINCKKSDESSFKVLKSGPYYSMNTKTLFDSLGYDYKLNSIIFDMTKEPNPEFELYRLNARSHLREKKKRITKQK